MGETWQGCRAPTMSSRSERLSRLSCISRFSGRGSRGNHTLPHSREVVKESLSPPLEKVRRWSHHGGQGQLRARCSSHTHGPVPGGFGLHLGAGQKHPTHSGSKQQPRRLQDGTGLNSNLGAPSTDCLSPRHLLAGLLSKVTLL